MWWYLRGLGFALFLGAFAIAMLVMPLRGGHERRVQRQPWGLRLIDW
jgi:hypothetical protein